MYFILPFTIISITFSLSSFLLHVLSEFLYYVRFKIFCCHISRQWILKTTQSRKYYLLDKCHGNRPPGNFGKSEQKDIGHDLIWIPKLFVNFHFRFCANIIPSSRMKLECDRSLVMNGSLALRNEKVKSYWQRGRAPIETPMPQILVL